MFSVFQKAFSALNKHERRRLVVLAVADVAISALDIALLASLLLLVHAYTQGGAEINWPLFGGWLSGKNLTAGLLVLLALFIAKNTAGYLAQKARYHFVYRVAARISELHLLQYLEGNYQDYVGKDSAVHIRRISQQPVEFGHYVLAGFQQIFSEAALVLLAVIAITWYDATLFLLLCAILLPPLLLLPFYIKRKLSTVRSNVKSSSEHALQYLKEALAGYIESNVFDKKDFLTARYANRQQTLNGYLAQLQAAQALPPRLMETFAVAGLVLLVVFNEWVLGRPLIPVVSIGAFLAAAYKIIPGLVKILNTAGQIKTYAFTAENKLPLNAAPGGAEENIRLLEVQNLSYNHGDKPILHNFSLCAKPGEIIGLSGISGKGKTTLFNLLLGFLEPAKGAILINGKNGDRKSWWKHISYVKQQPFLVHDSILANITLSNQYDEPRLKQAISASGIESLGTDTLIAENGRNISGGQRQRIAFARALYKNADLLLLDEPFNELDDAAEQRMLQQLQQLRQQGKIILLVTHNRNSLSFCTRTISLDA
jgi:ABC-type multidrug transport system fused ATPase/permease subunit